MEFDSQSRGGWLDVRGVNGDSGCRVALQVGVSAPDFLHFVGKSWESTYPGIMEKYYRAVESLSGGRLGDFVYAVDGVGVQEHVSVPRRQLVKDVVADDEILDGSRHGGGSSRVHSTSVGASVCSCTAGAGTSGESDNLVDGRQGTQLVAGQLGRERSVGCVESVGMGAGKDRGNTSGVGVNDNRSRGRWHAHNKQKKMRARQLKESGIKVDGVPEWRRKSGNGDAFSGEGDRLAEEKRSKEKLELQCSLEKKWAAENELRQFEAERRLRVLKSQDEDTIIRMQRAQVMRTTEKCKVDTERAFKSLLKSGNVAGAPAGGMGSVETVVSDGGTPSLTRSSGDTISPDSSASMQEFRKCQKDLLDAEKKLAQNEEAFERLAIIYPRECAAAREVAEMKTAYTLDSNGEAEYEVDGVLGPDGKIHVDNLNDIHGPNYAHKKYDEFRESMGEPYEYEY